MTQANATYELCVDLNGDGDFSDASEDISAYWMHMRATYGAMSPDETLSRSATLNVTLKNDGQLFSPEHANALSGFAEGTEIRLRMTYSATTVTLYQGFIDHIAPALGENGPHTCEIRCDGYLTRLQSEPVRPVLVDNDTSGAAVRAIMQGCKTLPAATTGMRFGIVGHDEIGVNTVFGVRPLTIEDGVQFYAWVGDAWQEETSVYGALRDITETERGFCFEDRDGSFKFWGRNHFLDDLYTSADATLDGTYIGPGSKYSYGEGIINSVEIVYNPRALGSDVVVLGNHEDDIYVPFNRAVTVTIPFTRPDGRKVGGKNLVTPVRGKDFVASPDVDRKRQDMSKYVDVTVVPFADRAEITLSLRNNPIRRHAYISGLRIRGMRFYDRGRKSVMVEDEASLSTLRRRYHKQLILPLIQDAGSARELALSYLAERATSRGSIERLSFHANRSATHMALVRDTNIGDRWAVSEGQTGVSNQYWVVGVIHDIRHSTQHEATYVLRPKPANTHALFGVTGFDEIGVNTKFA